MDPHLETTRFRVDGMDCASCGTKVDTATRKVAGVEDVSVSVVNQTMTVKHAPGVDLAEISTKVGNLGYPTRVIDAQAADRAEPRHAGGVQMHGDHDEDDGPWWRGRKAILTAACGAALIVAYLVGRFFPEAGHWSFIVALLVGLVPIGRRAVAGAMAGTPFSIETLMSIAAIGAVIIGATEEAATVVLLFLVGELLEGVAAGRARASIKGLADLVPKTARLIEGDQVREVPAAELALKALVMVRPGDRIPADGDIVEGSSAVDESPVTGESVPKNKQPGDRVFAGTINTDNVLKIRVTARASDNTISRVIALVEEAQESKAPTERFIDRFSRYYTPAVLLVGALVAVLPPLLFGQGWSEWVYKGLAILLIGCPCALVISTPAAIAAALSAGARRGLLLKGGAVVEGLRKIDMVALDKTGTLTEGKPVVTDILAIGSTEAKVLSMAAAIETGSSHPLALAIVNRAQADKAPIPPGFDVKAIAGKGVSGNVGGVTVLLASAEAAAAETSVPDDVTARIGELNDQGKTVSLLLADGVLVGVFGIRDEPRADAKAGLEALKAAGIGTVMLTGDNERTARAIGSALGMEVRAGLLPEDKQRIVRELQAQGKVVAKVGDGINDAPALAAADIGIAMGGGTDVALETADAAILHGRVIDIANMVGLSKATMANIGQNITLSLGLKAVFLVTTVIGVTGLWPAILADTGATVLVTANAMRLLGWRGIKANA
ncbi:MAG: cadmium-translocating P-type ATPase [Alphaproteobacteria bacterium]|nr:cadmium-translocating P-type ATPase [Alphaproteobacteria bacterium]MBU1560718.1 cadmium-translocating P-type ATPase [Alphaproteobacteria bacterium]MBU2302927.1 cadmium-translocating P-type ATPase [Alphaproteobacteria bacterium]MBU2367654.1 cadmium-translocating P-type ATPase [Alphaproteobacteria bacterium]